MLNKLTETIKRQNKELKELYILLETQHEMIMNKDIFGLEAHIEKLNECSKAIAKDELERRNLIGKEDIKTIINESDNDELKEVFNEIKTTLQNVGFKKETNDLLLKQQMSFNSKILNLINPNKEIKTYNSYGILRK